MYIPLVVVLGIFASSQSLANLHFLCLPLQPSPSRTDISSRLLIAPLIVGYDSMPMDWLIISPNWHICTYIYIDMFQFDDCVYHPLILSIFWFYLTLIATLNDQPSWRVSRPSVSAWKKPASRRILHHQLVRCYLRLVSAIALVESGLYPLYGYYPIIWLMIAVYPLYPTKNIHSKPIFIGIPSRSWGTTQVAHWCIPISLLDTPWIDDDTFLLSTHIHWYPNFIGCIVTDG